MALSSSANLIYYELEQFEQQMAREHVYCLKFENERRRLRAEVNRLHYDAHHVDTAMRHAGSRAYMYQPHAHKVSHRTYILRNEIGFAKSQLVAYTKMCKHPPKKSTIFSSPSDSSPEQGPGNSGMSSVFWFSPLRLSGSSQSSSSSSQKCSQ